MNLSHEQFRLHAYVDGELTPDEVADVERLLAQEPDAMAEVAALRAQKMALHARYDDLLTASSNARFARGFHGWAWPTGGSSRHVWALAASVVVSVGIGISAGWIVRGHAGDRPLVATAATPAAERNVEGRLRSFVQTAALSHAVFVPEVRHPVEVPAADEAHLVAWLSKRLAAPLVVPHLGEAGWSLLGGRLLPADSGPVAQFMYQDAGGRRMTLAVSRGVATQGTDGGASTAFRIAEEGGNTVFYWIDHDYAYALTGKLSTSEMTALAGKVHLQLDRDAPVH